MNRLHAIVFDIGNVLVHYDEALVLRSFAARTGKTSAEIERYIQIAPHVTELALGKITPRRFYRTVACELGFPGSFEEFAVCWNEGLTPIESMMDLAAQLATRLSRVALSNTNAIHMQYIHEHFPLFQEFDAQILSYEVGLRKPDPAIFELTLRRCGLVAKRMLFIDDLQANVEGGRAVGMQAIQFESAEQVRRELTKLGVLTI